MGIVEIGTAVVAFAALFIVFSATVRTAGNSCGGGGDCSTCKAGHPGAPDGSGRCPTARGTDHV